jgi:transposase-like protein
MRNVLAHAGKSGRRVVSAFVATAFAQETPEAASAQWRAVADQIRPKVPKLAAILDDAEPDVLAYMTFPNDDAIVRLVGALLLEQNDEWAVQRARYMTLESVGQLSDDPLISLPAVAR